MDSQVLLPCGQVHDEGGRDVGEGVEFIGLAKVYHVPAESLLIRNFPMELKMVKGEAVLPKFMVLEAKRILSPFEENALGLVTLDEAFSLG